MFPIPNFEPWQIGVISLAASLLTSLLSWFLEKVVPWIAGLLKHPAHPPQERTYIAAIIKAVLKTGERA